MKKTYYFIFVFAFVLNLWTTHANAMVHLCNRWNVMMDSGFELGPIYGEQWTNGYKLQGDTTINNVQYSCLLFADGHQNQQSDTWEWVYYGAIRETANAQIYFIPAGQSKEYLLFAFNANVGDKIDNMYVMDKYITDETYKTWGIVKAVSDKEIILDLYEQFGGNERIFNHDYVWVKGIGAERSMFQPLPNGFIGGAVVNFLLCAYNNEMQIYVSDAGEEYSCEYWKLMDEAIDNVSEDTSATKILRNKQIFILRGEKVYTLQGQEVK